MKKTTRFQVSSALLIIVCVVLGLQGCDRETPAKFIASGKAYLVKRDFPAAVIQFKNAVAKAPDSAEARYLLGVALQEGDDPVSAEIELRKALSAGYPPELVYPPLVRALLEQGQFEKALSTASELQDKNPAQAQLLALAGEAQLGLGKVQDARGAFGGALTEEPANETAAIGMAKVAVIDHDLTLAHKLVDEVLARSPSSRDALLLSGDLFLLEKRNKEAVQAYEKAIELRPRSVRVYLSLVPLLVREGDLSGARARVEALKRVAPRAPMTFYLDALVAQAQGDRPRARAAIDNALKAGSEQIPVLLLAGAIAHDSGDYAQAESYLRKVIAATPKQAYPRRLLVSTYLRIGQVQQAQAALEPLLELAPNDATNLSLAGEVALANRDVARAAEYYQKALSLEPNNARTRTRLGQVHLAAGDPQRAIEDLEAASQADPSGVQADVALLVLHLNRKELDKAQVLADSLVKKQPNNPLTHNVMGLVRLAKKDEAGARTSFEHALQIQPTYFPAARSLAILDLRGSHPEAAKQRYEAILTKDAKNEQALVALIELSAQTKAPAADVEKAIDRAIAANPASARARLLKITYLLQRGDAKGAISAAQQAQAALPQNPQVLAVLARAQMGAGEYDQAIASIGKIASLNPKSPMPLLAQAEAYSAAKDWAGARRSLQKALELQPDLVVARMGLARVEIRSGRLKEAQAEARAMQQKWPTQAAGYVAEVEVLTAKKDTSEAERVLRRAMEKVKDPALTVRLYGVLGDLGRKHEADTLAGTWVKQNPRDIVVPAYAGEWSMRHQDYSAAARWYKAILDIQPQSAVALNNLAWVLGQLKDPSALEYGQKALSLAPDSYAVLDTVGWLYVERGDFTKGLELLNKAHELAPNVPSIELSLAKGLIKAGQGKAARQHLEVLAKLPPGTPVRDDAEKLLSSL